MQKSMKRLAKETDEVLPPWEGFDKHPLASIVGQCKTIMEALGQMNEMIAQCNHTKGWLLSAKRKGGK